MEANNDNDNSGQNDLSALELLQMPVFVADKEGKVIYGNEAFADLVDRKKEHLEGVPVKSLIKSETSGMERALATGDNSPVETWATIKDKRYFFEYRPMPRYDSKGNITDIVEMIIDQTYIRQEVGWIADNLAKLAQGNLDFDLQVQEANQYTRKASQYFTEINENMISVGTALGAAIAEIENLAEVAVDGKLSVRADAAKHQGKFRKVVEEVNKTLDSLLLPITSASYCLKEMAVGNLDTDMWGDYKGDHAVIKDNLNATLAAMNDILSQVAIIVDQMANGAGQTSASSQSLSQAATESASSLEEITASMHQLASQTSMNADNASQASLLADQARVSALTGEKQMDNMVKAMNDINVSATNISKIIKAIDEIAFQTNLLALNAAVEAARAGMHGKGFTVVAEEVRNLAQRSATAAKETAEMIEDSIKKTEIGTKIAEETSKALKEIVTEATKVTDLIGEITSASKEQAQGIAQINQGLTQQNQVTQQVTANAEESASASEELSGLSLQLKQMLTKFKLKKQKFDLSASGLPEGITPEMLQMLQKMVQSQQLTATTSGLPSCKSPKKMETKPSKIIVLDDSDFGKF